MKLTSLDIHHKEFRHSLRGYAEEEVDKFLDEVADEFERLLKENIDLSEQLQAATTRIRDFEIKESAVNNAIISAQTAGEDMRNKARVEADSVVRDAEIKAKEIIHNALARKQQVAAELIRIKQAEEDFRARFKTLLEQHQRAISEVSLPDDVEILLGETDEGVEADVIVRNAEVAQSPVFVAPEPFEPADASEPVAGFEQETVAVPAIDAFQNEPPTAGFVRSVTLGEVASPDIPEEVKLVDPSEFSLPGLRHLGEREDDMDIEEID
jgi:cell division initiation protein